MGSCLVGEEKQSQTEIVELVPARNLNSGSYSNPKFISFPSMFSTTRWRIKEAAMNITHIWLLLLEINFPL